MARKPTDTVQLKLRFSERLRRRLEQAAKHNDWSMNTEIVNRLDTSFQREDQEEMIERAARDAVQAQQEVTRKLLAAELRKDKHKSPSGLSNLLPKGEDSK
jgi:Arc-like DNA binding domain